MNWDRAWNVFVVFAKMFVGTVAVLFVAATGLVLLTVESFGGHNISDTQIQIKKMEEALTVYAAKHKGRFPTRLEDAQRYFPDNRVPVDSWGNPFFYLSPAPGAPYVIVSLGADGRAGGENADADIVSGRTDE